MIKTYIKSIKILIPVLLVLILLFSSAYYGINKFKYDETFLNNRAGSIISSKNLGSVNPVLCKKNGFINPLNYEVATFDNGDSVGMVIYHRIINLNRSEIVGFQAGFYNGKSLKKLFSEKTCDDIKIGYKIILGDITGSKYERSDDIIPLSPFKKWGDWIDPYEKDDEKLRYDTWKYSQTLPYLVIDKNEKTTFNNDIEGVMLTSPIFVCSWYDNGKPHEYILISNAIYGFFSLEFYKIKEKTGNEIVFEGGALSLYYNDLTRQPYRTPEDSNSFSDYILHTSCENLKENFSSAMQIRDGWRLSKIEKDSKEFEDQEKGISAKDISEQKKYLVDQFELFEKLKKELSYSNRQISFRGAFYEYQVDHEELNKDFEIFKAKKNEYLQKFEANEKPNLPILDMYRIIQERLDKEKERMEDEKRSKDWAGYQNAIDMADKEPAIEGKIIKFKEIRQVFENAITEVIKTPLATIDIFGTKCPRSRWLVEESYDVCAFRNNVFYISFEIKALESRYSKGER